MPRRRPWPAWARTCARKPGCRPKPELGCAEPGRVPAGGPGPCAAGPSRCGLRGTHAAGPPPRPSTDRRRRRAMRDPLKLLAAAGRHGPALLCSGVLVGLAAPPLAELARPLMGLAVFVFTLGAFLKVDGAAFQSETAD